MSSAGPSSPTMGVELVPRFAQVSVHPHTNITMMLVPEDFATQHLDSSLLGNVTLKLEGMEIFSWEVTLRRVHGEIWITSGWKKFLRENWKGGWMFMIFRFDGVSTFFVTRYSRCGSRMVGPPGVALQCAVAPGQPSLSISFCAYIRAGSLYTQKLPIPEDAATWFNSGGPGRSYLTMEGDPDHGWKVYVEVRGKNEARLSRGWQEFVSQQNLYNMWVVIKVMGGRILRVMSFRITNDVNPEYEDPASIHMAIPDIDIEDDSSSDDSATTDDLAPLGWIGRVRESTNPRDNLKLQWPSFECKLRNYAATIPAKFARAHCDVRRKTWSQLHNTDGESWAVRLIPNGGTCIFSARFGVFMHDNKLNVGDACKFCYVGHGRFLVRRLLVTSD